MTYYRLTLTPQARATALVALVAELERVRDDGPTDDLGKRVRAAAIVDVQDAIDALHGAERTDDDQMPADAVARTVERARDAYSRFCAASDARRAADAERGIR